MAIITTDIESAYPDRKITVVQYADDTGGTMPLLQIERTHSGRESLFAYLTPRGAQRLIDALTPYAKQIEPLPPIDVIEVLDAALLGRS